MATNIMNEYIKLTKKHLMQYMKIIFDNKFNKDIFEEFLESYINARYYDLNGDKSDNTLKAEILSEIEKKKIKLKNVDNNEILEYMPVFFSYILYFDKVIPNKSLEKTIESINELRKRLLQKDNDIIEELTKCLKESLEEIENLLKKYESKDFYLKITNFNTFRTAYKVRLQYSFPMPKVYSSFALEKALNTGTISEDKLFIAYSLVTIQIIRDIIKGNFKKQYIIELTDTLFGKKQKLERLLKLIDNLAVQDKLNLKIEHKVFIKNKEQIYALMQRGFRFACVLDETFISDAKEIEKLKIFRFVLISGNIDGYYMIMENTNKLNIIEI